MEPVKDTEKVIQYFSPLASELQIHHNKAKNKMQ